MSSDRSAPGSSPAQTPIAFVCAACDILGFEWPPHALDEARTDDFLIRFATVPGLSIAFGHQADAARYVVEAEFEPAASRTEAAVAVLALKANHLRAPTDHCFSIDPVSGRLTARLAVEAATDDLAGFSERAAAFITMAANWRRVMDSPEPLQADSLTITTWG